MIVARYVKKQALLAILGAVVGLWLLKIVFDYLAELEDLSEKYTFIDAMQYILYLAPDSLQSYMPIGALLGAVVGLGMLANHSELVVMRASGISSFRIVGWAMQSAVIFVLLGLALSQFVLPTTNHLAKQIKYNSPVLSSAIRGYWDKQENRIIAIDYADANGQIKDVTIWQLGQAGELQQVSQAKTGTFESIINQNTTNFTQAKLQSFWILHDVQQIQIANNGTAKHSVLTNQKVELPIEPASIYLLTRVPEDMSLTELWQHQRFLAEENRRSLEHEVEFWKKVLSPFSVLSLVLLACSFVFGSLRTHSLGLRIVVSLLFGLVFSYIQDLVGFISLSTGFSPLFMVLLPILVSAFIGLYLLKRQA